MRRTKIIATVGPASDKDDILDALLAAGVDVVRLNFSHGTQDSQGATLHRVREAARRAGRQVAILQDLGGPKIRTGLLAGGTPLDLRAGESLRIRTGSLAGSAGLVYTSFDGLAHHVRTGDRLLLADGRIELRVDGSDGTEIGTTVVVGGSLGEHKGINAPGVELPVSAVTIKDAEDLQFGLTAGVDLVALSFVQSPADLHRARELATGDGLSGAFLVAKIERPQAIDRLDAIVGASDGIMVARGDLGLEVPLEHVPRLQGDIVASARRHKVPVIVATQVLESMTSQPRPTRAEVSDAAHAVHEGVDAIMLAGETAAGAYPVEAVRMLDAILRDADEAVATGQRTDRRAFRGGGPSPGHAQAMSESAVTLAERENADAIVAVTRGGRTACELSALRPRVPILAATDRDTVARRLALYWGVTPVLVESVLDLGGITAIGDLLRARGHLIKGATVVFVRISSNLGRADANYVALQRL